MSENATRRFSGRAEDYDRFRPEYPPGLLPLLADEIGLAPDWIVADVGSGTGLSSMPFLERGHTVVAVEPNADMRCVAEARNRGREGFRSVSGTAENTTLSPASVDVVFSAQAFHWFDPEGARAEFARIVRPGGWVVLVWNSRRHDATPFMAGYEGFVRAHGTDYGRVHHEHIGPDDFRRFFGGEYRSRVLPNEHVLDLEGVRGRARSISYLPGPGETGYAEMVSDLDALVREHAREGEVRFAYRTEIHFGRLGSP